MIHVLSAEECGQLLSAASIGRVGFVRDERVQIIPVNYVLDADDLIIRTLSDGVISAAMASNAVVTVEVDHLEHLAGEGWSVLMHGPLREITDPAEIARLETHRVTPWADSNRPLHLRFTPVEMSGRRVRRERNT